MTIYNFGSAILAKLWGQQKTYVLSAYIRIVNVVLNLLFVICCHLGVAGVAIATVISNVLSAALVLTPFIKEMMNLVQFFQDEYK